MSEQDINNNETEPSTDDELVTTPDYIVPRGAKGHYLKGYSGNPGGRVINRDKYYKALVKQVNLSEWVAIISKAVEQAKRGDRWARQWLSDYVLGKPAQAVDITSGGEQIGGTTVNIQSATDEQLQELETLLTILSQPVDGHTGGAGSA